MAGLVHDPVGRLGAPESRQFSKGGAWSNFLPWAEYIYFSTQVRLEVPGQRDQSVTTFSMASPLVSRTPQCMSCIRRMTGSLENASHFPGRQQIRGKKKLTKVSTVKVHLLQNIPGYGRRGE